MCNIIIFSGFHHFIATTLTKAQTFHFVKENFIPYHTYFLPKFYHTKSARNYFISKFSLLHSIILFYFCSFHSIQPNQNNTRGRLVHGFLESGMGFVHSKPIPDVWSEKTESETHTLNPQGIRILVPRYPHTSTSVV